MSKQSAVGIILKDDKILLMRRVKNNQEYWSCIGGGREENESLEHTVVREIQEESTVMVSVDKLLYKVTWDHGDENYFYLCTYISGVPHLDEQSEEYLEMQNGTQVYDPQWVEISKLPELLLFPLEVRDILIQDIQDGFKDIVQEVYIKREERRKTLS